jgi:hypothetical protein
LLYTLGMFSRFLLGNRSAGYLALLIAAGSGPAYAQVIVAGDDSYEVAFGEGLVIEASGVLDNDTLDGETAGENGATAELITDASHGTLALGPDGSFTYSPGASFDGTDTFVYRAVFGSVSDSATVTLTACTGGPQIFTCWKQGAFFAKAAALGHPSFTEGFEADAAWGLARWPDTLPSVSSRGFEWRANDFDPSHTDPPQPPPPPANHITTGSGAARTGQWGIYDRGHGYATGTPTECDIDNPSAHCLFHDGFTVKRNTSPSPFYGAGGFFDGTHGANVAVVIDGDWENPIAGVKLGTGYQFFGVIDAGPVGITEVQFRELDGKIGQRFLIFGDDFTILGEPDAPVLVPALGVPGMISLGLLLFIAGSGYLWRSSANS